MIKRHLTPRLPPQYVLNEMYERVQYRQTLSSEELVAYDAARAAEALANPLQYRPRKLFCRHNWQVSETSPNTWECPKCGAPKGLESSTLIHFRREKLCFHFWEPHGTIPTTWGCHKCGALTEISRN